jgi:hypothetical protein
MLCGYLWIPEEELPERRKFRGEFQEGHKNEYQHSPSPNLLVQSARSGCKQTGIFIFHFVKQHQGRLPVPMLISGQQNSHEFSFVFFFVKQHQGRLPVPMLMSGR